MKIKKTKFKDLLIIENQKYLDSRGEFRELLIEKEIKIKFPFNVISISKKNVIRGLHYQVNKPQGKFISVLKGEILDVAVDLRKNSKTFGKSFKIILSQKNATSLYIPKGFAHAYLSYDVENIIYYKLDNFYKPKFEDGIIFNDRQLKIKWPKLKIAISKKDKKLRTFKDFINTYAGL